MTYNEHEKELPLYRKVFIFSFLIAFLVVVSTAGTVLFYQLNQMENQLTERAKGIATLWFDSIPEVVIQDVIDKKSENSNTNKNLNEILARLMKKNSRFFNGYVVVTKKIQLNKFTFITAKKRDGAYELDNFSTYSAGKEFLIGYNKAVETNNLTTSQIYRDQNGMWITAFQPIYDHHGKIIAIFAANVNASSVTSYKSKMGLYLFISIFFVTTIVYFTLRWGLKKVFEPVHEIISGINAVSAGNFNVKLHISDQSDLAKLGENFNQMTDHLALLFERLSDTYKEFGSITVNLGNTHFFEDAIDEMDKIIAKTRIQKELQRAEKMNAIGQLAASVAHEIRNPMTVVRGFLQIFLVSEHMSKDEITYIQLMIEELNRAEMIINDYLSLAKPDLDQIEKVTASEIASKVMDLMNTFALMSKNITLQMVLDEDVYVKGNQGELKQVLINIVKNGIEAMKSGGILSLKVKKSGEFGLFEISDTGIGMSSDELCRLGTAFYSLKEKGTGIGLMVCYQIVDKMRGHIDVKSIKGEGTTFRIYVPLWSEEMP
ncbi:sensor histidine kinase [Neobacillus massiliamazoniensis]|uniref:histidine kinase n=1 Tax=Neobacillus massiliamazoniensis TaxID=1499688 RepID=A0A0U1P0K4_9BACI|nr:ATP-binding protein [Neobacillus massiliamazoniensis]CRK83814.1 two-component sensor histidine kinase [Neobacillus massiliamazoniensis]